MKPSSAQLPERLLENKATYIGSRSGSLKSFASSGS